MCANTADGNFLSAVIVNRLANEAAKDKRAILLELPFFTGLAK